MRFLPLFELQMIGTLERSTKSYDVILPTCREPRETTLVVSPYGLFITSLTNCASCE